MAMTPAREFVSRPRESERTTRRPLGWWDRIKFLLLFAGLFAFFVAAEMSDNPLLPFREAFNMTLSSKWWIVALFGLEVLRQIHFFICEHSAAYYRLWRHHVYGRWNRHTGKFNAYTRYRVARALKVIVTVLIVLLILARIFDTTIFRAPYDFLNWLLDNTPQMIQIVAFLVFWIGFQFGLIIYFATRGGVETFFPDDIETRFEDVWGQDQVRDKIKENLLLLEDPQVIEQHGGYVPAGLLLWGPPGTGKTLMAEAMAGESGKPFVNIDASMLNTMGMGVLKVKLLFRKLRKYALKYDGVVAFFDEADAIGSRGQLAGQQLPGMASTGFFDHARMCGGLGYLSDASRACLLSASMANAADAGIEEGTRRNRFFMGMGGMGGGGGGVLQVLLTEMSGLKKPRGLINRHARRVLGMKPKPPPKFRIVIVMATNLPEALDPAMLRPGRMGDRIYKVGYPSKAGRIRTYWGYFDKIPNSLTQDEVDRLATVTPYATGASIKGLVNEALINAIQDGRDNVEWRDVVRAKQLKDLGPPEDVEYIERERHATALHEACHAVVAYRVRHHLVIDIATIEKGANYLGMVSSIPPEDLFTRWRSDYEADVMVSLASLIGEKLFFEGDSSSGVSNDLEQATQLAILMEGYWGMGSTIASHGITHRVGVAGGGRPGAGGGGKPNDSNKERELLKGGLAQRIEVKLSQLADRTETLLIENRVQILAVTHALESHKTLTGEDVEAIIEFKPGPLVDGRPYGTAEFAELAERYHEQVLAAHDAHGDVAVPLPPVPYVPSAPVANPVPVGVGAGTEGRVAPEPEAPRWAPPTVLEEPGNGKLGNGTDGGPSDTLVEPSAPPLTGNGSNGGGTPGPELTTTEPSKPKDGSNGNGSAAKSATAKGAPKSKDKTNGKSGNGKKKGAPKSEPGEKWGWGAR